MADYSQEDVVIPQVDEIAIYYNRAANIVILQKDGMGNDDAMVVIPYKHAKAVVKKLQALIKDRPEPDSED